MEVGDNFNYTESLMFLALSFIFVQEFEMWNREF